MPAEKSRELVSIHILDEDAAPASGHQRIAARVGRRHILPVAFQNAAGIRSRQLGGETWTYGQHHSHNSLLWTGIARSGVFQRKFCRKR